MKNSSIVLGVGALVLLGAVAVRIPARPVDHRDVEARPVGYRVNINAASAAELELLPGIGPTLAGRIVQYRTANGAFATIERLDDVRGIGPAKLEALRQFATTGRPKPTGRGSGG